LFKTTVVVFLIFWALLHFFFKEYSGFVLLTISLGAFSVNYIFLSMYYAYRFAVQYNDIVVKPVEKRVNARIRQSTPIDEESYKQICSTIGSHSSVSVLNFLQENINLSSNGTLVYVSTDTDNLQMMPIYQYSSIVQLERLNNTRGINKKLKILNEKLPDNGIFVCCFESKSTRKTRILKQHLIGLNYIYYSLDFIINRVMPKIFITRNLYNYISGGKNRIFSKSEILGRLYCFGFEVIENKKIGKMTYVIAERKKQPTSLQKRIYGPLIRLRRLGKEGKPFEVYKMRTMHPYSEYLQDYIYENNSIKDGGKFNKDIRVTTTGGIMRKYWLDELPMIINLFRGEMKLVGVRPLSAQYFSLYNKELQKKRNKHKPGLMPPFYADLPKTLEEIQESEMKYLLACEKKGLFLTDFRYFFLILKNIVFKKARSG
jgi:lipopolysaccharide/colanic/teichoic acid biosynthesis glycosyltransferase